MIKEIEDVFKNLQGGQKELYYIRQYIDLLERENKALAQDNEMKCGLNDELSKENKKLKSKILGLERTVDNQRKQLERYTKAQYRY